MLVLYSLVKRLTCEVHSSCYGRSKKGEKGEGGASTLPWHELALLNSPVNLGIVSCLLTLCFALLLVQLAHLVITRRCRMQRQGIEWSCCLRNYSIEDPTCCPLDIMLRFIEVCAEMLDVLTVKISWLKQEIKASKEGLIVLACGVFLPDLRCMLWRRVLPNAMTSKLPSVPSPCFSPVFSLRVWGRTCVCVGGVVVVGPSICSHWAKLREGFGWKHECQIRVR